MTRLVVLLDDGGVLNDNALRGAQWQRLVPEFFVPILGGTPEAWVDANRVVFERLYAANVWQGLSGAPGDFARFERRYYEVWLGDMCELMGLPRPPEQQCFELGVAAERFIIPRIRAAFPGAVEAIRTLHAMGYALHTASGASSVMLEGYLEPLGVRDCFGRLYGPDLIEHFKDSPTFYERLLADLGLPAQNALVVDDNPKVLCWAAELGAHTMLVGRRADVEAFPQIGSLAELPSIIGGIGEP